MPQSRIARYVHRRLDWFLIGMSTAVALAWMFPDPGADGGWMHPEVLTKAGVSLVFFLHGVALPFAALKAGMLRWPLHLTVQLSTFMLFPVMGLALLAAGADIVPEGLKLGIFYLCALPSTVSSSVALTAAARGNVAAAVFNATLSALIGVVLTPLLIATYAGAEGTGLPLGPVILDLVKWLVVPLVIGQAIRPWMGGWAARNKKYTQLVDRATILMLVYTSFCDSVKRGVWSGQAWHQLVTALIASCILLAGALAITSLICRLLGFNEEDRIAAVFCGSKKTLASGVPMASLIFGKQADLGLILVPIMIYHPIQLIVCGILAGRWGKRGEVSGEAVPIAESPKPAGQTS